MTRGVNKMFRRIAAALLAFLIVLPLAAREAGKPDYLNLFGLIDTPSLGTGGNWDAATKQEIYPAIGAGTGIFVTLGQSRISDISASGSTRYTPTNGSNCINLNPYDGHFYKLTNPALGASWNPALPQQQIDWMGRLCDKLITAGKYTQVVFIPIAQSGSSVVDWMTGGFANIRLTVAASWLTAKGITPTAWLWQQGTTDCINAMTQATYQTDLRAVIAYERGLTGRSADKWMIAEDSVKDGTGAVCTAIEAAQAAVAADANNFVGPNADGLPTSDYDSGPHFNDTGNDAIAGLWSAKVQAAF